MALLLLTAMFIVRLAGLCEEVFALEWPFATFANEAVRVPFRIQSVDKLFYDGLATALATRFVQIDVALDATRFGRGSD